MVVKMIGMLISGANVKNMANLVVATLRVNGEEFASFFAHEENRTFGNDIFYTLVCSDVDAAERFLMKKLNAPRWMVRVILRVFLISEGAITVELATTAIMAAIEQRLGTNTNNKRNIFKINAI